MPREPLSHIPAAPFRFRPAFLREIQALTEDQGLLEATHTLLARNNIGVTVHGDFETFAGHEGGVLMVGNHAEQWEFVAAMDMLHQAGRRDMLNIAKFYVQRQVHQTLGELAAAHILPVFPRILTRDRPNKINNELGNRLTYHRFLLDAQASARRNDETIARAGTSLESGGVVNIFPCGSVVDAHTHPWRHGVGRIVQALSEKAREQVLVVNYGLRPLARTRLIAAVAMQGRGMFGRPQTMDVELAPPETVASVYADAPAAAWEDSGVATEVLRQRFLQAFSEA